MENVILNSEVVYGLATIWETTSRETPLFLGADIGTYSSGHL